MNIISKLDEKGGNSALIASEMKKRKSELFPPGVEWDASKFDSLRNSFFIREACYIHNGIFIFTIEQIVTFAVILYNAGIIK